MIRSLISREPVLFYTVALALVDALVAGVDLRQAVLIAVAAYLRSRVSPVVKEEAPT